MKKFIFGVVVGSLTTYVVMAFVMAEPMEQIEAMGRAN